MKLTYEAGAVRFVVHHGNGNAEAGLPVWKDDDAGEWFRSPTRAPSLPCRRILQLAKRRAVRLPSLSVLAALEPAGGWRPSGDVVVSGHSHTPRFVRHASGVAFLNPGTAGGPTETRRFGATFPRQCAIVRCSERLDDTAFEVSAIDLETGASRIWIAEGQQPSTAEEAEATSMATRKRRVRWPEVESRARTTARRSTAASRTRS